MKLDKTTLIIFIGFLIVAIAVSVASVIMLQKEQTPQPQNIDVKTYYIPSYNIVYNISKFVNTTIYELPDKNFVLIVYSSKKLDFDINETYEIAKAYNLAVYLYDIEKPWFGLKITENTTIPLIPFVPIPAIICVHNDTAHVLFGDSLKDKQNILLLMEKCIG